SCINRRSSAKDHWLLPFLATSAWPSTQFRLGGGWASLDRSVSVHIRGISSYPPRDAVAVQICHAIPIDQAILSFQFEQRAIVPCHCFSRHMSRSCQPIKVKSGGRCNLSQNNGAALRRAYGAHEF